MTASEFPLVLSLLAQTTAAPFPMPQTYGEGLLIFGVVAAAGALWRSQEARIKRAEGQVDALTAVIPEILRLVRVKEAQHDERNTGRG